MFDPFAGLFPRIRGAHRASTLWGRCASLLRLNNVQNVKMQFGHRLILDRRSFTESWAFYSGLYDDSSIEQLGRFVVPGSCFVDVGANIGFYSVALGVALRDKSVRIFAYEPGSGNFQRLQDNVALNNLSSSVSCHKYALSSQSGNGALVLREDFKGGSQTGNASISFPGDDETFIQEQIQFFELDQVWDQNNRISAVKVDIEGHEDEFLRGGLSTIIRHRPIILMEVNNYYYKKKNASLEDACRPLREIGYSIVDQNSLNFEPNLDDISMLRNVWLIPAEKFDAAMLQLGH